MFANLKDFFSKVANYQVLRANLAEKILECGNLKEEISMLKNQLIELQHLEDHADFDFSKVCAFGIERVGSKTVIGYYLPGTVAYNEYHFDTTPAAHTVLLEKFRKHVRSEVPTTTASNYCCKCGIVVGKDSIYCLSCFENVYNKTETEK